MASWHELPHLPHLRLPHARSRRREPLTRAQVWLGALTGCILFWAAVATLIWRFA